MKNTYFERRDSMVIKCLDRDGEEHLVNVFKEDFPIVQDYRLWRINKDGYAAAYDNNRPVLMHKLLCRPKPRTYQLVDHIDGNKCNNKAMNLRVVYELENVHNYKLDLDSMDTPIPVKGVGFVDGQWYARIYLNKIPYELGQFDNMVNAIMCKIRAEYEEYGKYASSYKKFMHDYIPMEKRREWLPEIYAIGSKTERNQNVLEAQKNTSKKFQLGGKL